MAQNLYISRGQFEDLLADLDYAEVDDKKRQDLLDRATADLEADLSQKFIVPLTSYINGVTGVYNLAPAFARNKVLNAMKCKLREIIGYDKNRNLPSVIESTQKFINVHKIEYNDQMKGLLNPKIVYSFTLQPQAIDSQTPVQHLALSRANNRTNPFGGGYDGNSGEGWD